MTKSHFHLTETDFLSKKFNWPSFCPREFRINIKNKIMTLIKKQRNEFPVFGDMMTNLFDDSFFKPLKKIHNNNIPAVNISEDENGYSIQLAVPGMQKDSFDIDLNEDLLIISSKVKEEKKDNATIKFTRKEFNYGNFSRSFNLPEAANKEKITANYFDGILEVRIAKREDKKPITKKIEIS